MMMVVRLVVGHDFSKEVFFFSLSRFKPIDLLCLGVVQNSKVHILVHELVESY